MGRTVEEGSRERMILTHYPMVREAAERQAQNEDVEADEEDLVVIGTLALIDAMDRYDPRSGRALEAHLRLAVELAIRMELLDEERAPGGAPVESDEDHRAADQVVPIEEVPLLDDDEEILSGSRLNPLGRLHLDPVDARLREVLMDLPERERALLDMYYFKGLSYGEIGVELGMKPGAVARQHRSLRHVIAEGLREVEPVGVDD